MKLLIIHPLLKHNQGLMSHSTCLATQAISLYLLLFYTGGVVFVHIQNDRRRMAFFAMVQRLHRVTDNCTWHASAICICWTLQGSQSGVTGL